MRKILVGGVAALTMLAGGVAMAQDAGGSAGDPPSKVWVYGANGWMQRDVGVPQRAMFRGGQRVDRPMIYWQSGGNWYAMPDRRSESGFISEDLSKETPGGANK